jgi:hypothetical protein
LAKLICLLGFSLRFFEKIFYSYSIEPVSRTGVISDNIGSEKAFADVLIKFVQPSVDGGFNSIPANQPMGRPVGSALTLASLVVWSAHAVATPRRTWPGVGLVVWI